MIEMLRMVKGAVSTKDLIPVMTHFCFYKGRVQAMNGRISIDAPLPELAISATVPAIKLVEAVDACKGEPTIKVTDSTITISEGKLRVRLPIQQNDAFPRAEPDPQEYDLGGTLLAPLARLRPFVADDATRPWSLGVWFDESGVTYATNNVVMVTVPCDLMENTGHSINLPVYAIDELLRIGKEPTGMGVSDGSVTFYFDGGAWLRVSLLSSDWPTETVAKMFGDWPKKLPNLPEGAVAALETIARFCPDKKFRAVKLGDGRITTMEGEQGAEVEGFDFAPGVFNADFLLPALRAAERFEVTADGPSRFDAEGLRGLIVGVRT